MRPATILLVDDDFDFVQGTRLWLEGEGYRVLVAYDGDEGLALAREHRPDLVVLDVIMPVRDGFGVCAALKADAELGATPVLMLTSLAAVLGETRYALSEGLGLEADDYLDKPVEPAELLRRVERLLARRPLA